MVNKVIEIFKNVFAIQIEVFTFCLEFVNYIANSLFGENEQNDLLDD